MSAAKGRQPKERLEQKSTSPLKSGVRSEDPPVAPAQEDTEDRRTVEVRLGEELTVPLTQDLFLHHFESPRNGGGAVDDVTIDEDERVVHVVFQHPEGWSCGFFQIQCYVHFLIYRKSSWFYHTS